jgi:thiosulfate/3-mercaptopyruvate sulfurtransferase
MAMKTGFLALPLVLLEAVPLLACQSSPLRWPPIAPSPARAPVFPRVLIGAKELTGLLKRNNAIPLDVRGDAAYRQRHLPRAVPVWSPEEEDDGRPERVRALLAARGVTCQRPVILYGGPDREVVARLFWLLRRAGCPEIRILDGGFAAWTAAGHPLETQASRRSPAEIRLRPRDTVSVDSDWVGGAFGQAGVEILDVRDARGWDRWLTPPTFGAGHIPYSLPFDPRALLAAGDRWPDPAELRRRLGTLGPRPGDPVHLDSTFVLYGEDARDPGLGLGYLLLTLAGLEARVFPGGWREWAASGTRPAVRVISAVELAVRLDRENPGLALDREPRELVLLDLREARDFAIGHLPGARSLPFHLFTETFERTVEQGWPGADRTTLPVVLYCYGTDCVRSRKAGAYAARLGFRDVLWFRGGVKEWRAAGLPFLDSPPAMAPEGRVLPASGAARP